MPQTPPTVPEARSTDHGQDWTVVGGKGRGRAKNRRSPLDFHSRSGPATAAPSQPSTSDPAAVAHIQTDHARIASRWRQQPSHRLLEELITAKAASHDVAISQAICLGAGSFGSELDGGEPIRRAHVQTDAFLFIVGILSRLSGKAIPCFFQEPLYTDADKAFLIRLGHSVIEAPAAHSMVSPSTLVFAIHLPTQEYLGCLTHTLPAMLIGASYECYTGLPQFGNMATSPELERLQRVHQTFSVFEFPQEKHDYCFSDTCVYWQSAPDLSSKIMDQAK